jgi:hypothetical protein
MSALAVRETETIMTGKIVGNMWTGEMTVFCPHCKAFQTVWLDGSKLMPTRKFIQERGKIYHDCGSMEPCRLYPSW